MEIEPLSLEPGHYQSVVDEINGFIFDARMDIATLVEEGNTNEAISLANEVKEARFWLSHFENMRDSKDSDSMIVDAAAKMFQDIGKAIQENEVTE